MLSSHFDHNGCHLSPDGIGGKQSPEAQLPPASYRSPLGDVAAVALSSAAAVMCAVLTVGAIGSGAGPMAIMVTVCGVTVAALMAISYAQDIVTAHRAEFDRAIRYRREMMRAHDHVGRMHVRIRMATAAIRSMSGPDAKANTTVVPFRRIH